MKLNELIAARKKTQPSSDRVTKLLVEIEKLDAKREENVFRLHDRVSQLKQQLQQQPTDDLVMGWLEEYRPVFETALVKRRDQFGDILDSKLQIQGIKLRGQYPELYAGLFTLQLDFDHGYCRVWYGPKQEDLGEVILDADKVAMFLHNHSNTLGSGGLGLPELTERILQAYRHARLDCSVGLVPLLTLLPYMALSMQSIQFRSDPRKEHYRNYSRADFSFDLYRLRETMPTFRLIIATRQQTQKHSDFLWVPSRDDVDEGHYYAMIDVKEDRP